jgi:hypothetical protein
MGVGTRYTVRGSNPNLRYFRKAHVIAAAVIEAGGFRVGVPGHALRDLDSSAVGEIIREAGRAEGVAADRRSSACIFCAPAHHAPYIGARQGLRTERLAVCEYPMDDRRVFVTRCWSCTCARALLDWAMTQNNLGTR